MELGGGGSLAAWSWVIHAVIWQLGWIGGSPKLFSLPGTSCQPGFSPCGRSSSRRITIQGLRATRRRKWKLRGLLRQACRPCDFSSTASPSASQESRGRELDELLMEETARSQSTRWLHLSLQAVCHKEQEAEYL